MLKYYAKKLYPRRRKKDRRSSESRSSYSGRTSFSSEGWETAHSLLSTRSLGIPSMFGYLRPKVERRQHILVNSLRSLDHGDIVIENDSRPHSRSKFIRAVSAGYDNTTNSDLKKSIDDFEDTIKIERRRDWLISFHQLDPRYEINKFFNDVARGGAERIEEAGITIIEEAEVPLALRCFSRAAAFSVWRPTSNDAIRKMMRGECAGKGLDVKGKSAKTGVLSGFIPLVQIHEEKHKKDVRWPPKGGSIRIYYQSDEARNIAILELTSVSKEMATDVLEAKEIIAKSCSGEAQYELALKRLKFEVADPEVHILCNHLPSRFGIDVAERIFFNVYISKSNICRSPEYCTGRPSEPAFQDMNLACVRKEYKGKGPRAVVFQHSPLEVDALSPQSLVVAYEEHGNVIPVASDFDCFLVGTRHVDYVTPLSKDQVNLVKWLLTQIETILDSPITSKSWMSRWLEVLKESASTGFYPEMPEFGFGDPKSYAIMEGVVDRMKKSGAVRHGAECFNYFFPQELDEKFLVVSNHFEGNVSWKSVDVRELQDILCDRIKKGYTFPLNPKWILADHGWKAVYDKMMASNDKCVKQSLDVWYPKDSGIRELIEDIYKRFPNGFQRSNIECGDQDVKAEGTEAMDLAEQQLKRHIILQRAKFKLRVVLRIMKMGKI